MMVVSGGMNQQRNQVVDAVVIARILDAALVVPILQVNDIHGVGQIIYLTVAVANGSLMDLVLTTRA